MRRFVSMILLTTLLVSQAILFGCADAASAQDNANCITSSQGNSAVSPSVQQELAQRDLSVGMAQLDVYYVDEQKVPSGAGSTLFMMAQNRLQHECPERTFTLKERWALGVRKLPDGQFDSYSLLFASLMSYHKAYGGLPANGIELYSDLAESTSLADFNALGETDKYVKYRHGVNPITGKFYTSFDDESWSPGGISIKFITDPGVIKDKYPDAVLPIYPAKEQLTKEDVTSVAEVWEITVYGEEKDSVLFSTVLFT